MPAGEDKRPNTHAIHHNNNKYIFTNMEEMGELIPNPPHKS